MHALVDAVDALAGLAQHLFERGGLALQDVAHRRGGGLGAGCGAGQAGGLPIESFAERGGALGGGLGDVADGLGVAVELAGNAADLGDQRIDVVLESAQPRIEAATQLVQPGLERAQLLGSGVGEAGNLAGEGLAHRAAGIAGPGQRLVHGAVDRADLVLQRAAQPIAGLAGAVDRLGHGLVEAAQLAPDALAHLVARRFELVGHVLRQRIDGGDLARHDVLEFAGDGLDLATRFLDRLVQRPRHAGAGLAEAGYGHARNVDRLFDEVAQLHGLVLEIAEVGHARRHRGVERHAFVGELVDQV